MKIENRQRSIPKIVRFTKDELGYVQKKIAESPFKDFQNYALHLLIQGEVNYVDYSELKNLISAVNKIGNNMNQVVKLANQTQEVSEEDIQYLIKEMTTLQEMVGKKFTETSKKERTI